MIENIKKEIYQNLEELFATAVLDEMAGDIPAYRKRLKVIADVADILGINTEICTISFSLRTDLTSK